MWFNANTGEVSSWLLNGIGQVTGTQSLDWRCSAGSGCAGSWTPIGLGHMDNGSVLDLLWWNPITGEVSAWLLNGYGNVLTAQPLTWTCGTGCAWTWRPIGFTAPATL